MHGKSLVRTGQKDTTSKYFSRPKHILIGRINRLKDVPDFEYRYGRESNKRIYYDRTALFLNEDFPFCVVHKDDKHINRLQDFEESMRWGSVVWGIIYCVFQTELMHAVIKEHLNKETENAKETVS